MKSNRILFLLMAALLFTACDAGKYYAKKKINRHYEELANNEVTTPADQAVVMGEEKEISSAPVTVLTEEKNADAPATSPQAAPEVQKRNTNAEQMQHHTGKAKHSFTPHLKPVIKELTPLKKQAGEKTVGKGLLMIVVALLLLLLALLFTATLGDLGLVFAIIFYIGAVVLFVAGIIVMFIGN